MFSMWDSKHLADIAMAGIGHRMPCKYDILRQAHARKYVLCPKVTFSNEGLSSNVITQYTHGQNWVSMTGGEYLRVSTLRQVGGA